MWFRHGIEVPACELPRNTEFGVRPIRITVTKACDREFTKRFQEALTNIRFSGLEYDLVIAKEESSELQQARSNATTSMPWKPTNKICIAIDIIKRAMVKLDTKLYGGQVYKKVPEGRYAYVKAGSVLQFLHSLLCNPQIADVLAPHIHSV